MTQAFYQNFTLGILGGGQLGRMLIQASADFNLDIAILDPDENAPCKGLSKRFEQGQLTDFDTVYQFGKTCDLLTIEIENVNIQALRKLQYEGVKVFPQPEVIELIQDKRVQKQFFKDHGIPTSDFILTDTKENVMNQASFLPAVNKLGKEGYDGRGVQIMRTEKDLEKAFEKPSLIEKLVDFQTEISVIVARSESGEIKTFPAVELSYHPEHNLVEFLFAPAKLSEESEHRAQQIAKEVVEKLDMVGLLAVEMFVEKDGSILVNEVAPRPHNSGHQTIEANFTSQYEQHLRAILDLPLGETEALCPSVMVNVLGEDNFTGLAQYEGLNKVLALPGVSLHLYGKKYTKPFRKMGHVTVLGKDLETSKQIARQVKNTLKVIA